jgi:S-adenosylmethionine hydrolase
VEAIVKFITLLTDFGLRDGYVGVMRGVIWGIAPDAQIADISHDIAPQNVLEGALALGRTAHFFPPGTVHVAVVDPGVGTHRRPIAVHLGQYYYVLPDNGLISVVLEQAHKAGQPAEFVHLDNTRYWLPRVSNVFHGRDIFSPTAAHLANGVPFSGLGTKINDPVLIEIPHPQRSANGWRGQVIEIDRFGNLCTDITRTELAGIEQPLVHVSGKQLHGLARTFGDRPPGDLIALIGTHDDLIISVVNGSAARMLGARVGDAVEIETPDSR